jgi:hypothetical protein
MYEIFARTSYQAISMRCMRFLRRLRIELLIWDVAKFLQKRRNVAKTKATQCCEDESDAMLRRRKRRNVAKTKATHCCEDENDAMLRRRKRRNVAKKNDAKTKATKCKQSYCNVSSFKNKFFVQVRRYIRSLMQKNNCEIEILMFLKFTTKIFMYEKMI